MLDHERQCRVCDKWVGDVCEEHEFRERTGDKAMTSKGKVFDQTRISIRPGFKPGARFRKSAQSTTLKRVAPEVAEEVQRTNKLIAELRKEYESGESFEDCYEEGAGQFYDPFM